MESKRATQISCVYHPQEYITNFCRDKRCLMPLCPYCIGQHTEYHQPEGRKPLYYTIQQSISEVVSQVQNLIFSYEQDKTRNIQVIMQIHKMDDIIHQKILIAKNMTYRAIDESFDQLEKNITLKMQKTQEQYNVYSLKKCQQYDQLINQTIQQLYYILDGLKRQTALSNLIQFHKQRHNSFLTLHTQISRFLHANQNYTPFIQICHQNVHSLNSVIGRMIKTEQKNNLPNEENQQSQKKHNKILLSNRKDRILTPTYQNEGLNRSSSRVKVKTFNNDNSPYKNQISKVVNSQDYRNQYENLSQRVHEIRRENQVLSKILKY